MLFCCSSPPAGLGGAAIFQHFPSPSSQPRELVAATATFQGKWQLAFSISELATSMQLATRKISATLNSQLAVYVQLATRTL